MVPLIEDQMHQVFKAREEERCRLLEAETGKSVKRRDVPKPWTRQGPHALCQDSAMLALVSEYDYRLSDKRFKAYCAKRGVFHVAGKPRTRRWLFMSDYRKTKAEYQADPFFADAERRGQKRYKYTPLEMEIGWQIIVLGRAALQDCWELFRRVADAGPRQRQLPL